MSTVRQPIESKRWTVVGCVIVGIGVALMFVPVPFRIAVEGTIRPSIRVGVFAPEGGTLSEIVVDDGDEVAEGDWLLRIENRPIELQRERLHGEAVTAETELAAVRTHRSGTSADQLGSPSTRVAVLRTRVDSLTRQVELIDQIHASLTVRASKTGRAVISDEQSEKVGQTVAQGQTLMQIVNDRDGYQIVVDVPADCYAYISNRRDGVFDAAATLRMRSSPEQSYSGRVVDIANTVRIDGTGQSVIRVMIDVDDPSNRPVRDAKIRIDAPVIGHVIAGRRSLGFVLFRPIVEQVRRMAW